MVRAADPDDIVPVLVPPFGGTFGVHRPSTARRPAVSRSACEGGAPV
jgi:hypothetical protein